MDTMQQETGDQVESGHKNLTLKLQRMMTRLRYLSMTGPRRSLTFRILTSVIDKLCLIHNKKTNELIQTEPLHGARPRQPGRERPPVIEDRSLLEAAGCVDGRKPDQAPLLSPGRQILMEEEVKTPPRGGRPAVETQGLPPRGAVRLLSLRVHHAGSVRLRAVPNFLRRAVHGIVV